MLGVRHLFGFGTAKVRFITNRVVTPFRREVLGGGAVGALPATLTLRNNRRWIALDRDRAPVVVADQRQLSDRQSGDDPLRPKLQRNSGGSS
jgi:hypothetical protein